jgi:uridine kinase
MSEEFGERAMRLSLDDFYLDRSHLPATRRARLNFDHPRAIDWERLEKVLSECRIGRAVSVPRYDFATHARRNAEERLDTAPLIIVEGLWLFRRASLRRFFSLKVFIRSAEDLCVERRMERDTRERGRSPEQVLEQLQRFTLPSYERYVAPQEKWADVILEAPVSATEVSQLMNRIAENLCAFGL